MQKQLISLVAALLISSPLIALAANEPPANTSPTVPATTTAQDKAWSEQLQKMQAAHEKMAAAKTPAERRIAMQEGMDAMRGGIGMMQGQCPGMGMGMGMGKGMAGGKYHSDQMMDLMQKMMDQQSSMMKQPLGQ
ncbi:MULTISPECIES: hypothetical protein [Pseudomonas]|uniref:hypothetical protein n=1 Tax=Pseudomonas sp. MIL9 TaxID=2807620 RepID=UPI001029B9BF|nr:hypothetical protein [Pseudomonas sp. MIL9]MBM6444742.1 hypothetical protein [Pseudomonas sp. MIL9]RZO07775.1 hypothetical protein EKG40_14395 [Pseudomonas moorei]